ncbi:MAG: GntR family transcriptional regulator [Actinomycetes bacterium]|jgi:DNA-binding GntR family transcriptional regulator|nr:MAG: GntR family transcriptional regulator [Actinomycetota bacterium]
MTSGLEFDLDRSSPVPLYFQVAEQISEAIRRGDLAPGARLDNEIRLADRLGLSRPTVRQAIQYLVDKGLLVRKRGVGTQVVHGQVRRPVELTGLHDDLRRAGREPSTRVLEITTVPADEATAAHLGVPPGTEVVRMERLRYARGEPIALLRNWLPAGLVPLSAETLQRRGLYELLRASGVRMRVANQRVGARAATPAEARLLEDRRGAPLITMERTTYDDRGRAVEHGSHLCRASHYSLEVTLIER